MLYLFELKKTKKGCIIFTSIIIFVLIVTMALYPLYTKNESYFLNLFSKMSPSTLQRLGIDLSNCFEPLSYYSLLFSFISIFGALFAAYLGVASMSIDRLNNANEFYFIKPIKRKKIIHYKILANISILFISTIIYNLISFIMILIVKSTSISYLKLFQINSSLFLLELVFLFIGMLVGLLLKNNKTFLIPSIVIVIIFELLNFIEDSFDLVILKYINPFSYFTVTDIITTGKYQYSFLVASTFIVFFLFSFVLGIYESEEIGGDSLE